MAQKISRNDLVARDLAHVWHPCSQMKDYERFLPVEVTHAQGSYLQTAEGPALIDAISSWWCKSLGHQHPRLKAALQAQLEKFEHVILANTTNETIVELSERLSALTPMLNKVAYASDGSCAVEMALKMSVHAQQLLGQTQRTGLMALGNGYHGETALTLSVSDLGLYKDAYQPLLHAVPFIENIPYVSGINDPLWDDCASVWPGIEKQLSEHADTLSAIIVEPIVQGAGGMRIYSADFLRRLRAWTQAHGVHLIADEIMTGLGRTGQPLACNHANISPDFLCLSKGLTSGWLPLSALVTSQAIYDLFYDDYATGKAFMHSHTYSGNALAAAVAVETLKVLEEEGIYLHVQSLGPELLARLQQVADETGALENVRGIGGVVAAELKNPQQLPRLGYQVYQAAVQRGALLRPLGNTLYWLPPLNIAHETLEQLQQITIESIQSVCQG